MIVNYHLLNELESLCLNIDKKGHYKYNQSME
jgi:hypothetical protein